MLAALLNVPKSDEDWNRWALDNQTTLSLIRQAIQTSTGNIVAVIVTSNGSGYTSAPTVTITDARGNGKGATAFATYTISGGFYSISVIIISGGAGYIEPVVSFSGGGGTGAQAVAEYAPIVNLPEYQTYPIDHSNPDNFQFWLINNSQAHNDFNSYLDLQSSDLTGVDINNPQQLEAWVYLCYHELDNACFSLGIS